MAAGYIYVLVNSSLPDLVKVGKTTRSPAERAQELSKSTGVPTQFVVAFEEYFDDCDNAEDAVHSELEARGFRQSKNREFFRAKPNEVMRVILKVASRNPTTAAVLDEHDESSTSQPWADILNQAYDLLEGNGDELQDTEEALRLYKLAARMGSPEACRSLGQIYFYGIVVPEDHREALNWFKNGATRGLYTCYMDMARVFLEHDQTENALKSFRKFFDGFRKWLDTLPADPDQHSYDVEQYLHLCLDYGLEIECTDGIEKARAAILSRVEPRLQDRLSATERQELTRVQAALRKTFPADALSMSPTPAFIDSPPALVAHERVPAKRAGFLGRLFSGG